MCLRLVVSRLGLVYLRLVVSRLGLGVSETSGILGLGQGLGVSEASGI